LNSEIDWSNIKLSCKFKMIYDYFWNKLRVASSRGCLFINEICYLENIFDNSKIGMGKGGHRFIDCFASLFFLINSHSTFSCQEIPLFLIQIHVGLIDDFQNGVWNWLKWVIFNLYKSFFLNLICIWTNATSTRHV
jgi:hypothetical protein